LKRSHNFGVPTGVKVGGWSVNLFSRQTPKASRIRTPSPTRIARICAHQGGTRDYQPPYQWLVHNATDYRPHLSLDEGGSAALFSAPQQQNTTNVTANKSV
jgi:hypothetical protein